MTKTTEPIDHITTRDQLHGWVIELFNFMPGEFEFAMLDILSELLTHDEYIICMLRAREIDGLFTATKSSTALRLVSRKVLGKRFGVMVDVEIPLVNLERLSEAGLSANIDFWPAD